MFSQHIPRPTFKLYLYSFRFQSLNERNKNLIENVLHHIKTFKFVEDDRDHTIKLKHAEGERIYSEKAIEFQ